MNPCPDGANYAAAGKLLAVSDFFSSATAYVTVPVGYGGLIYDLLNIGNIITLQVLPQPNNTTSTAATTVTTSGQNSTSGWLNKSISQPIYPFLSYSKSILLCFFLALLVRE
jgi:hypothetical protein